MTRIRNLAAGVALGALATGLSAAGAYAQQTTSAIHGVALDVNGKPLAGAAITVVHVPTGVRATTVTNSEGGFDLRGLRPGGPYRVTATAANHSNQTVDDVYLTVATVEQVNLTLADADTASKVSDVVITAKKRSTALIADVGSRTTLRAEAIEAVVTPKRDLRDIGRRDPLANLDLVTRGTGPTGGLYIAGALPRSNRITIDGVRSQDDFGLNTGGLSTNRGPISLEALEQATIQDAPFDVEEGDFTGGALNLITKAGSNDFHGTFYGFTRTGRDVGVELPYNSVTRDANGNLIGPANGVHKVANRIRESNEGLAVQGPIIRDTLFFAGSYERYVSSAPTVAGPYGAGFATAFLPIPGVSTGAGATTADINNVLSNWNSYAAHTLLNPGGVASSWPIQDEKASARIDWNIIDGQRLTATWRRAFSSVEKSTPSSAGGIALDTNTYAQPEVENNYSLQLNSKWTQALSTEVRVSYREYQRGQTPPEGQNFAQFSICTDPAAVGSLYTCTGTSPTISFGPDQFRQANVLNTRDLAGQFVTNYRLTDDHLIKFGYQYRGIHIYDLFVQQAHGVYYFDSVSEFAKGYADQLQYGTDVQTVQPADAAAELAYKVHTVFAQDSWDIMRGLTVNYGLRYDYYQSDSHPVLNPNFVASYGFNNQKTYDGLGVLMPRVSAKWRTDSFEIAGGIGRVSGGIPDVFLTNSFGANTGYATNAIQVRRIINNPADRTQDTFIEVNANSAVAQSLGNQILTLSQTDPNVAHGAGAAALGLIQTSSPTSRTAYTNSLAPNFEMPADWKANISAKTHRFGFDWQFDAVATQSDTTVAFRDLRARLLTQNGVQLLTPDGRLRYDGLNITAANRALLGLPNVANTDLTNLGATGDIQAYNPHKQNWTQTAAFTVGKHWGGFDGTLSFIVQRGYGLVGISEFGTTEGGNTTTGNYYADQTFSRDPNGAASGRINDEISDSLKLNLSYKHEFFPGFLSRFTLFGENHSGRPINFLGTDPAGNRNPTFGTLRDDGLIYVPNLSNPNPNNPLEFTDSKGTTVFFANQAALTSFTQLVQRFNIPQGGIVPRGAGEQPRVSRFDFQYAQEVPVPFRRNDKVVLTLDISNLGNLINPKWGVVKEYGGSRNGIVVANVQCADASGNAVGATSPVCATYRYSYTTANAATTAAPTVDPNSLYSVVFGVKYKF